MNYTYGPFIDDNTVVYYMVEQHTIDIEVNMQMILEPILNLSEKLKIKTVSGHCTAPIVSSLYVNSILFTMSRL